MFGAVGAPVERLVRVRIGPVRIDDLRTGAVRPLKAPEVRGSPAAEAAAVARATARAARPKAQKPSSPPRPPKPPTAAGSR